MLKNLKWSWRDGELLLTATQNPFIVCGVPVRGLPLELTLKHNGMCLSHHWCWNLQSNTGIKGCTVISLLVILTAVDSCISSSRNSVTWTWVCPSPFIRNSLTRTCPSPPFPALALWSDVFELALGTSPLLVHISQSIRFPRESTAPRKERSHD